MTSEIPTTEGLHLVSCEENDGEWETVNLFWHKGLLMVDDPHIGQCMVEHYHNGLTNIEWRKV